MVKLLVDAGANIDIQDESGNTALHYGAASGKKDVVSYLLDNKSDATITNIKEQKAIDYSNIKGFNEITEMIIKSSPSTIINFVTQVQKTEKSVGEKTMEVKKKALLDLKDLLDAGILSPDEFQIEKSKILNF